MRFLFICGSLEPGCNGVGDYTRLLALRLSQSGHKVRMLALHDPVVSERVEEVQEGVACHRFSASLSWAERTELWIALLKDFRPEIVSLQFVPFAFEPKGLPVAFLWCLRNVVKQKFSFRWHIMFHELWVGFVEGASRKHRLWGLTQRHFIKMMIAVIKPVVMHTSNLHYVNMLCQVGIEVGRLPLFSSFEDVIPDSDWMEQELAKLGIYSHNRNSWRLVVFFGSYYPSFPLEKAIREELLCCTGEQSRLAILGIGRADGEAFVHRVRLLAPDTMVMHWGRQPKERVVALLLKADLGLPTASYKYIGKSAVAAAMHWAGLEIRVYGADDNDHLADGTFSSSAEVVQRLLSDLNC